MAIPPLTPLGRRRRRTQPRAGQWRAAVRRRGSWGGETKDVSFWVLSFEGLLNPRSKEMRAGRRPGMTGTTTEAGHTKPRPHSRGRGQSRQQTTATATSILFCEGFERESSGLRFLAGPKETSLTVARQPRNHTGFPANPPEVFSFKVRTSHDVPRSLRRSAASRKHLDLNNAPSPRPVAAFPHDRSRR